MKTIFAIILISCMLSGCIWTGPFSGVQYDITNCGCEVEIVGIPDDNDYM